MFDTCPKCGGVASLLQSRDEFEELTDLGHPTERSQVRVKIEEYRCQDVSCEHEFERIIREPAS